LIHATPNLRITLGLCATGGDPTSALREGSAANGSLSDSQARHLISDSRRGDAGARERLIERYLPLVKMIARRFANRGEQLEDLVQVGTLGLIAAIDRFDLARNVEFPTFAIPTIVGEIKNHLRDRTSAIRIPRRVHELTPSVRRRELELSALLERPASPTEVAVDMGLRESDVQEVVAARCARAPLSIADPMVFETQLVGDDNAADICEEIEERLVVVASLRALTRRDRDILRLRFVDELTQAEIADLLGISQGHVSRLIRSALARLRQQLLDDAKQPLVGGAA
jgi:RNA polymerase sigma-B factor